MERRKTRKPRCLWMSSGEVQSQKMSLQLCSIARRGSESALLSGVLVFLFLFFSHSACVSVVCVCVRVFVCLCASSVCMCVCVCVLSVFCLVMVLFVACCDSTICTPSFRRCVSVWVRF